MKKIPITALLAAVALFLLPGCSSTYQRDCRVRLLSDPTGAEVWKGGYYMGTTPLDLHFTATAEDDDQGYLQLPHYTLKLDGYQPHPVEMKLDLEQSGDYWEGEAILETEK